jgi:glycosyltransferase involved in cell wall biosynthesis
MSSLIVTLDPANRGGVRTMQRAVCAAHVKMGLAPHLAFSRQGRLSRWNPSLMSTRADGYPAMTTGYLPTLEYLNYVIPALKLRSALSHFPIVQLVSGFHSASLIPILARRPFISWVATPFGDEISSRRAGERPTMSIRLNHRLRRWNERIERWSLRYPKTIFALSRYTAARLSEVTGIPLERFEVLRCPVDVNLFRPTGVNWQGGPARYFLSVGRIEDPRKNFASLVRAFAPVAAREPDLDLVIVGPMDRRDNLVAGAAREAGIAGRVHLVGVKGGADLAAIYRGAQAYVMASRQEGLGIVVAEAQASGLPVVVMRCGGSDELVDESEESRDGWLVGQGDEAGLSQNMLTVAGDQLLRARLGAAARRKAEREHSHEAFVQRLSAAYQQTFPEAMNRLQQGAGNAGQR